MANKPKDKKSRKGIGGPKPRLDVTQEMLDEVKVLAGRGLTNEQVSWYYGVSTGCWYATIKRHPKLASAFHEGKAKTISMVSGKLIEAIRKGNISAMIFYLKTQARWSDTSMPAVNGVDNSPPALTISVSDPVEAARIYQQIMIGS
jgi:hypothetical protein